MVPESLGAELRIHYGNGCFDTFKERMVFEQALNAFLGSYKLERWASGKDMLTGVSVILSTPVGAYRWKAYRFRRSSFLHASGVQHA